MIKNLIKLLISITLCLPVTSYGESNTDLQLSETIKKLKELKPDNVELIQISIENGFIKIEGNTSDSILISNYFDSIDESKIGKVQDNETITIKRDGQYINNFVFYVEPASVEDLHPFVSMSDTGQSAWWFGAEFHPSGQAIRGIPIETINAKWCNANEFERDLFPKHMLRSDRRGYFDELSEILKDGRSFSITGKLDGVHQLTALVGIYETCRHKVGTFLLLLDVNKPNKPVAFLKEYDTQFFAYLKPGKRNDFTLLDCYGCDGGIAYQWDRSINRLVEKNQD